MGNFGRCPRQFSFVPWRTRRKRVRKPLFTGFLRILEGFPICPRCPRFCPREGFGDRSGDMKKPRKYGLSEGFEGNLSPLSPISGKIILFFIFSFLISFSKIGDNGDKIRKRPIFPLFSGFSPFSCSKFYGDTGTNLGTTGTNGRFWNYLIMLIIF